MHVEFLLEEPSAEAFLQGFLPRILPDGVTWNPIVFQGKRDLLLNLEKKLQGYRTWLPEDSKIVVLIDEDREDCKQLKQKLENAAKAAGFSSKTASAGRPFQVLNRIAIEELEAWFLGDAQAMIASYPRVSPNFCNKAAYRDPDSVKGGTWEALERLLQRAGYYPGGLAKIEVARAMGTRMEPVGNRSKSFEKFLEGIHAL